MGNKHTPKTSISKSSTAEIKEKQGTLVHSKSYVDKFHDKDSKVINEFKANLAIVILKLKIIADKKKSQLEKNKKNEIIQLITSGNYYQALTKFEFYLRSLDDFICYYLLAEKLEKINGETRLIMSMSTKLPPAESRVYLDTLIYVSARIDMEELVRLRQIIEERFGAAYIKAASSNLENFVDQDILQRMKADPYEKGEVIKKLEEFSKKANIQFRIPDDCVDLPFSISDDLRFSKRIGVNY